MDRLLVALIILFSPLLLFGQQSSRIDSLRGQLDRDVHDTLKILAAVDLSRALHDQGEHDQDHFYARNAAEEAERYMDTLLYSRSLDNLGLIYRFHQHYAKALPLHVKAYDFVKDKKVLPHYKMRFANNAAVAARYDQLYDQAVNYFIEALKIAELEQDLRNIAIASNGLGNTFINIPERGEEALYYFLKALKTEEQQRNNRGIAINYLSISDYFTQTEQFDTARVYLNKLMVLNEEMQDRFGLAMTFESYGHNFFAEGLDLDQAKTYYFNSLDIFRKINNRSKQAEVSHALGDVFLQEGNLDLATDHYQQSLKLARSLNHKQLIKDNAAQLSHLYKIPPNLR